MLDKDLEKLLDDLWQKNPTITKDFLTLQSSLLLVQELRNIRKDLSNIYGAIKGEK